MRNFAHIASVSNIYGNEEDYSWHALQNWGIDIIICAIISSPIHPSARTIKNFQDFHKCDASIHDLKMSIHKSTKLYKTSDTQMDPIQFMLSHLSYEDNGWCLLYRSYEQLKPLIHWNSILYSIVIHHSIGGYELRTIYKPIPRVFGR